MDKKFIIKVVMNSFNKNKKAIQSEVKKQKKEEYTEDDLQLIDSINETVRELEVARSLFDTVSDPQLIELAIHAEDVARSRFDYLISIAKKKQLKII
jgi:Protein of unknown function (DUF2508)